MCFSVYVFNLFFGKKKCLEALKNPFAQEAPRQVSLSSHIFLCPNIVDNVYFKFEGSLIHREFSALFFFFLCSFFLVKICVIALL